MDNVNGLVFIFLTNESADIESAKTGGVEAGCGCAGCGGQRQRSKGKHSFFDCFFDCLRVNVVADFFICLLVTAAHVFVVSGNEVRRRCCAAFADV